MSRKDIVKYHVLAESDGMRIYKNLLHQSTIEARYPILLILPKAQHGMPRQTQRLFDGFLWLRRPEFVEAVVLGSGYMG